MATVTTHKQKVAPAETGGNHPRWIEILMDVAVLGTLPQNEIYQVLDCIGPIIVHSFAYEIITPFTATVTIEVGKGGGTEVSTAFAADAAAGTDGVGTNTVDILFADDTVDVQILVAAATAGSVLLKFLVSDVTSDRGWSTLGE